MTLLLDPSTTGTQKNTLALVQELCLKNRIINSDDMAFCMRRLSKELPFKMLRYPAGKTFGSWPVPPAWNVREAFLSDGKTKIASYEDHPLFVAAYSKPFEGWVTRDELLKRTGTNPKQPDHFIYEHRLIMNYNMRLKDWRISLPYNLLQTLTKDRYYVKIDAKVENKGALEIADYTLVGKRPETFVLLSHLCHTGQANDGLAGVAVGIEIMKRLRALKKKPTFTYKLLVMPETIGSAVYLSDPRVSTKNLMGTCFLEMPGQGDHLTCNHSRLGRSYFDMVLHDLCKKEEPGYEESPFGRGMLNDEMNFDWPSVNVPSLAIYRQPFHEYHTSADHPGILKEAYLEQITRIMLNLFNIMETDFIPEFAQRGPVYLTRYNLYFDAFTQQELFRFSKDILYKIDGKRSLYQISRELGVPWKDTYDYIVQFVGHKLIKAKPLTRELLRGDA